MKDKWYILFIIAYITYMCGFLDFSTFFTQSLNELIRSLISSIISFVFVIAIYFDMVSIIKIVYNKIHHLENTIVVFFPFIVFNYPKKSVTLSLDITVFFNTFYPRNLLCDSSKGYNEIRTEIIRYEKNVLNLERLFVACVYFVLFIFRRYFFSVSLLFFFLTLRDIRLINNDLIVGSIYRIDNTASFEVQTLLAKQLCLYSSWNSPIYTEYVNDLSGHLSNDTVTVNSIEFLSLDLFVSGTDFFNKKHWVSIKPILIDNYAFGNDFTTPLNNALWSFYRLVFLYAIIGHNEKIKAEMFSKFEEIKSNCTGAGSKIMNNYLDRFMDNHSPEYVLCNLKKYIGIDKIFRDSPTGKAAILNIMNKLREDVVHE
ncbi:MAG: hypothetical protein IJL32_03760 [Oscillospiraceae bacterium]|nr:hypothetical protein [Oscillospiraceae bacterium]